MKGLPAELVLRSSLSLLTGGRLTGWCCQWRTSLACASSIILQDAQLAARCCIFDSATAVTQLAGHALPSSWNLLTGGGGQADGVVLPTAHQFCRHASDSAAAVYVILPLRAAVLSKAALLRGVVRILTHLVTECACRSTV